MAKLKLNGIVTKISGKFSGAIFATGHFGNYIKSNSYTNQPNSPLQSIQRNKISLVAQTWRTLTPAQKQLWKDDTVNYPYINAVGDTAYYTGYALYNKLNTYRKIQGLVILQSPLAFIAMPIINYSIPIITATGIILGYQNGAFRMRVFIYATKSMHPEEIAESKDFLFIGFRNTIQPAANVEITSLYQPIFGLPISGKRIHFHYRTVIRTTGSASLLTENTSYIVT